MGRYDGLEEDVMKKLTVCTLILILLLGLTACNRQKKDDRKDSMGNMVAGKTYTYEKEGFGGDFTIQIHPDGTFEYHEGPLSSHIGKGSWMSKGQILILCEDGKPGPSHVNSFKIDGNDLVFLSENSSNFPYIKAADGERFTGGSEET